jgi:hypothetical protein
MFSEYRVLFIIKFHHFYGKKLNSCNQPEHTFDILANFSGPKFVSRETFRPDFQFNFTTNPLSVGASQNDNRNLKGLFGLF